MPERHPALDGLGGLRRGRVVPGGVLVDLAVDGHVVVAGHALPGAHGGVAAGLQVFRLDALEGEVDVVFDDFDFVVGRFGDDGAVPDCFGHCILRELWVCGEFSANGGAGRAGDAGPARPYCSAAICRRACSNSSAGWPPEIRWRWLMMTAGTELMPCWCQKPSRVRTSSANWSDSSTAWAAVRSRPAFSAARSSVSWALGSSPLVK